MSGRDDDTAVQRKAQLRLLSSLPALQLQDSAKRTDASGIAHRQVPEVRRSLRRDGRPETHQYLLRTTLPKRQAAVLVGSSALKPAWPPPHSPPNPLPLPAPSRIPLSPAAPGTPPPSAPH